MENLGVALDVASTQLNSGQHQCEEGEVVVVVVLDAAPHRARSFMLVGAGQAAEAEAAAAVAKMWRIASRVCQLTSSG